MRAGDGRSGRPREDRRARPPTTAHAASRGSLRRAVGLGRTASGGRRPRAAHDPRYVYRVRFGYEFVRRARARCSRLGEGTHLYSRQQHQVVEALRHLLVQVGREKLRRCTGGGWAPPIWIGRIQHLLPIRQPWHDLERLGQLTRPVRRQELANALIDFEYLRRQIWRHPRRHRPCRRHPNRLQRPCRHPCARQLRSPPSHGSLP